MAFAGVSRLSRVGLTVGDLPSARGFYVRTLGFTQVAQEARQGASFADLMGAEGASARAVVLRLGADEIELLAFTPPGRAYPPGRTAADPWFQHMAIVVADMNAAYAELEASSMTPISSNGPQLLPPSTGGVTAFKFRDPEGHPLELSYFPAGVGAARWRDPEPGRVFLGIDHSAIGVADVARSLEFYVQGLGFTVGERLVNRGPTQSSLDGLVDPVVDIVTLHAGDDSGPHIELLGYRTPSGPPPIALRASDVAATRLVLQVQDLEATLARLPPQTLVSRGAPVRFDATRAAMVRDPDGHALVLQETSVALS